MKLSLASERLTDLTIDELLDVVGGNNYTNEGLTCPVFKCVSEDVTCRGCHSLPC